MWDSHITRNTLQDAIINPYDNRTVNFIKNIPDTYYYDIEKQNVIDVSKSWATIDNILLIKEYIDQNPKILVTVRPLVEIVLSIIKIQKNDILQEMKDNNYSYNKLLSENNNLAEYIIKTNSCFNLNKFLFYSYKNDSVNDNLCFIKYDDIVLNADSTFKKIYSFLGIDFFQHNFNNIKQSIFHDDKSAGLPEDLHKIKSTLSKDTVDYKTVLSEEIIDRINSLDYFYQDEFFR
jgi:hypothetical protein